MIFFAYRKTEGCICRNVHIPANTPFLTGGRAGTAAPCDFITEQGGRPGYDRTRTHHGRQGAPGSADRGPGGGTAKWDGSIKAGVDITKVTAEANDTTKEILIHIPEAKILSHEIQEESIETLDEKNGLFNQIKVEDIREFDAISKDAMEQRAIDNGILDKAFENAKEIIYQLVHTELVEELEYTITFEVIEE